jgi:hypothetical protein
MHQLIMFHICVTSWAIMDDAHFVENNWKVGENGILKWNN